MSERLFAIRGATGADNTAESIKENVCEMCLRLFSENGLSQKDFVSIQFTVTEDLDALNPAAALRKGQDAFDVSSIPLFCSQEPRIVGSPEKMIRVMITVYMDSSAKPIPVYINGGERLRPDFAKKN
ncbi:MAG: chorismate mutase [Treponema sp.]|uniref:chorismate mutase n=1 Tax=Treponema sp. TaxID=166 RepID=UPI001B4D1E72|nr:chorismate mutase [Treponema sp.]MBP3773337.1 chorismate mutase [Treponema sp.]MBQ9281054.1 chorismate mutase [Treponema sp.]